MTRRAVAVAVLKEAEMMHRSLLVGLLLSMAVLLPFPVV